MRRDEPDVTEYGSNVDSAYQARLEVLVQYPETTDTTVGDFGEVQTVSPSLSAAELPSAWIRSTGLEIFTVISRSLSSATGQHLLSSVYYLHLLARSLFLLLQHDLLATSTALCQLPTTWVFVFFLSLPLQSPRQSILRYCKRHQLPPTEAVIPYLTSTERAVGSSAACTRCVVHLSSAKAGFCPRIKSIVEPKFIFKGYEQDPNRGIWTTLGMPASPASTPGISINRSRRRTPSPPLLCCWPGALLV